MSNKDYYVEALNALANVIHDRNVRLGFYEAGKVRGFDGMMMNVVGEVSEAQEEWRKGKDFRETYWTVREEGAHEYELSDHLRLINGRLHVRNYDYDFQPASAVGIPRGTEPEWLPMTPELLRRMPNMIRHLKPEGIPSELADIIIRVLDVCGFHGIDIAAAIADKMAFNETRQYRHGGKLS